MMQYSCTMETMIKDSNTLQIERIYDKEESWSLQFRIHKRAYQKPNFKINLRS